jgi:predicted  nucleic acid-binding Zn-ribbon protein
MTFLGRVFTIVILVCSVAFFVAALLANASHMNYKEKLVSLRSQVDQLNTTIKATKTANEKLQTSLSQEQIARRAALAALQTQLDLSSSQLAEANKKLSDLNSVNTMQNQNLSQTIDRLKSTQSQNEAYKMEIDKVITDRNSVRIAVIKLTDELNSLKSIESDLVAQVKQLQDSSTMFEALSDTRGSALKSFGLTDVDDVPPADLRGEVLAVNSNQLVEISLGRDDGLREGHTLEIYRGAQYLGRVQISKTQDDKSIGKILASFRKGYIQAGDKVASKVQ